MRRTLARGQGVAAAARGSLWAPGLKMSRAPCGFCALICRHNFDKTRCYHCRLRFPGVCMDSVFVVHLTDVHLFAEPGGRLGDVDTDASLREVLDFLRQDLLQLGRQPDLILMTGDLSQDGSPQAYARLKEAVLDFRAPLAVLPGNHDLHEAFHAEWREYEG